MTSCDTPESSYPSEDVHSSLAGLRELAGPGSWGVQSPGRRKCQAGDSDVDVRGLDLSWGCTSGQSLVLHTTHMRTLTSTSASVYPVKVWMPI